MMLRSNTTQSFSSGRVPLSYMYGAAPSPQEAGELLVERSEMEHLMQRLVPEDVSPVKRAVIERLVTVWISERRHSVA